MKKNYKFVICRGSTDCSNSVIETMDLIQKIDQICDKYLTKKFSSAIIPYHQLLKIYISHCPNGCSRPQIADIGIIGASVPQVSDDSCSGCGECTIACREKAVIINQEPFKPIIDYDKCLYCAECIRACSDGVLKSKISGYRIIFGGKLGRHPRLGIDLGKIFTEEETLKIITDILTKMGSKIDSSHRVSDLVVQAMLDLLPDDIDRKKIMKAKDRS